MSTTSRSQSSSPDILGPPGDAEYLISSPIKPFAGRQSFLSPANVKRQRTPAKRSRVSLSPAKSAHSIQFNDVLLPGSPTMKLNDRQRSLSPEKSDGNVSPWRIRVTLEATQDEENENQGSPARKRLRPSTVTTKVPLKDDRSPLQEKTPARRRGRPRKSDIQLPNGSPWPGSPGNTPGPKGGTPQKGKRGRPRKGTPKPKAQEIPVAEEEQSPAPEPAPAPVSALDTGVHFSPMDTAADEGEDPPRQWSPVNIAAGGLDSDSLGADDLPVANLRVPTPAANGEWNFEASRDLGRTSYDTPVIGVTEHHFLDHDANIPSTPSKMPSPNRERSASSARSPRPAESNSSPHTYPPTPTSSPDEEEVNQNGGPQVGGRSEDAQQQGQPFSTTDPTNEHEEFDSIMESEGFTMISLDTLPSVKQSLGSGARVGTGNPSNRENGRLGERLKRRLPGGISELRSDNRSSAKPSPAASGPSSSRDISRIQHESERSIRQSPAGTLSYPQLPMASSEKTREASSLGQEPAYPILADDEQAEEEDVAESIEAPAEASGDENEDDIGGENEEYPDEEDPEDEDDVEVVDPSPRTQRTEPVQTSPVPLRMQREADWQMEREAVSRQAQDPRNQPRLVYIDSDEDDLAEDATKPDALEGPGQSNVEYDAEYDDDHVDERAMEEEEGVVRPGSLEEPVEEDWDKGPIHEVRYADPNYAHQRSVIQHTNGTQSDVYEDEDEDDGSVDIWHQEPRYSRQDRPYIAQPLATINESTEMNEEALDDGFDDIWQQEARDHSRLSESSDDRQPIPSEAATNAWRRMAGSSTNPDNWSSSPAYVTMEYIDGKHHKPTHIRKLREEEVDLSAMLAEEDTPNRARYYDGTSTPRSFLSRRSGAQHSSINGSSIKSDSSRKAGQRVRLQPISQSSPERESEGEQDFSVVSREDAQSVEIDEGVRASDARDHDTESTRGGSVATPEPARQSEEHAPTSTWFQRITSLTPRWLKAPTRTHDGSSSEGEQEDDQDDNASIESAKEVRDDLRHVPSPKPSSESPRYFDELAGLTQYDRREEEFSEEDQGEQEDNDVQEAEDQQSVEPSVSDGNAENYRLGGVDTAADLIEEEHVKPAGPRLLAASGYFSDDHYKALRGIYRMAKQYPERFTYYDSPGRAKIIGDWIWTSDGHHGVPITEIQFAIIDRFVHDLSRADVQYGGSGQVDWTEADLHRRLISIIIGEQIREERKAKAARGASVDTWR